MADPPPVLTLLVQKGPCKGEILQCRDGAAALRVGRVARGNDLAVRDAGASQSHLSVEFLQRPAARWAVTDLGSSNGTLLNGASLVPTVPAPLSHGDLIKIGESTVLAISISDDAGPGPAATRRSARNAAAAAEEEQAPPVTGRGGRKKAAAAAAPEAAKEVKEAAAVVTRRGGRKKAAGPLDAEKEAEEEAAVVTRRGGRKKAPKPPEVEMVEEEEEAAVQRRGVPRKAGATDALPPQPQNLRSTRAAARRSETMGCGNDDGKVASTGTGRGGGRITRASSRKGTNAATEDEMEGEEAVARDLEGNPLRVTTAMGGEEEDMVETRDGTSNASEVLVAVRGRAKRSRGGRGRATRASTRKAEDAIVEEDDEKEEMDTSDGREHTGSPLRVMGTSMTSMEDEKVVDVEEDMPLALEGRTVRATVGRVSVQHAPAVNGGMEEEEGKDSSGGWKNVVHQESRRERMVLESKMGCVGEEEENGRRVAIGGSGKEGHVEERTGRSSLEDMTLREWFVQIEKYLLAKNEKVAEMAIAEVREKHRCFCEHLKTLKKSSDRS